MKKLFGVFNISWKFLLIFSIIIGITVGILNRIPFLIDTSFTDISVYLEMWIILAIFIIVNSKSWKDAAFKCFIFFLVSQPLIYFTEIVLDIIFKNANFLDTFILYFNNYYIHGGWLFYTFLTIPGAIIAYQVKKDNILSSFILSVATCFLSYIGVKNILNSILFNFPNHILNGIICLFMSLYLIFITLNKKKNRVISVCLTIVSLIISIVIFVHNLYIPMIVNEDISFNTGTLVKECKVENIDIATCVINDDYTGVSVFSSTKVGKTKLVIYDENDVKYNYNINSNSREFTITKK